MANSRLAFTSGDDAASLLTADIIVVERWQTAPIQSSPTPSLQYFRFVCRKPEVGLRRCSGEQCCPSEGRRATETKWAIIPPEAGLMTTDTTTGSGTADEWPMADVGEDLTHLGRCAFGGDLPTVIWSTLFVFL